MAAAERDGTVSERLTAAINNNTVRRSIWRRSIIGMAMTRQASRSLQAFP
jgi:hypothetical protein